MRHICDVYKRTSVTCQSELNGVAAYAAKRVDDDVTLATLSNVLSNSLWRHGKPALCNVTKVKL